MSKPPVLFTCGGLFSELTNHLIQTVVTVSLNIRVLFKGARYPPLIRKRLSANARPDFLSKAILDSVLDLELVCERGNQVAAYDNDSVPIP